MQNSPTFVIKFQSCQIPMKHKAFLKEGRFDNKQYPKNSSRNKITNSQQTKLRPSSKHYRNSLQGQNYKRMLKNPQQIMMIKTLIKQQLQLHDINEQITNAQQMSIQNLKHKILEKNKEIQIQRQKLGLLRQNKKIRQKQLQFQQSNKQIKQLKKHIAKIYQCLKTKDLINHKQNYNTHNHYHYDQIDGQQSIINSEVIANWLSQSRLNGQNNQKHLNGVDKKLIVETEQNKRQKKGKLRRPPSYQLNGQNLQIKYTDSWVGELKRLQNQPQKLILKDHLRQKSSRDSASIKNSNVRKNMNMVQSIINIEIGDASLYTINGSNKINKGLVKQDLIIQQSGLYEYSNSQHENRNQMNKSNLLSSVNSNNELRKIKKQQNQRQNTSMVQQSIIHIQIPKESLKMPNNTNLCQSSPINSINQRNDYHSSSTHEIHNNLAIEEEVLRNNNRIEKIKGASKNLTIAVSQLERQSSLIPMSYDQNYKSY